ncbi:MAG TPA: non-homologous end-joining DNA ligase [Candidatus Acidoferrum sp.]|nr:non-homologous end-joining DNA ligase [Candidatus Acidoferrum sp.]
MGLQRYKEKRNFTATPEPAGKVKKQRKRALMFVIQKHDATRLHYDFRLEIDGVLASWAVPKGIPTTKGDRRLAMHVEDHPIDYGDFEGIIPEGNYGSGSVMVWDTGTWETLGGDPITDVKAGKVHFALHGKKLEGEWTLVRMKSRSQASGKDEWLLIKSGEDVKAISAKQDDQSVLTRRTMAQIAGQKTRTWQSSHESAAPKANSFKARIAAAATRRAGARTVTSARSHRTKRATKSKEEDTAAITTLVPIATDTSAILKRCPAETPKFIEPMKAKLIASLPSAENWLLELKHDGFRVIAVKNGKSVELFSRNYKPLTAAFAGVTEAVRELSPEKLVLDGEVVALDERGHGSFQLLQNRESITDASTIVFYVFDLLNLDGRNTRHLQLTHRRELLQPIIAAAREPIRFSATLNGAPEVVLAEVKRLGLEGLIGKKPDSRYEPGQRSGAWVKLKCVNEQEFVIGGYTPPKGSRDFFGSIVVGFFEKGKLMFASKVGTGFNQKTLREMHTTFQPLRRPDCPFVNLPTKRSGKFGQGISASEMKRCTWLEPKLVAQVRFGEWTSDGGLRQPVFLGLREDKRAEEVTREQVVA